MLPERRSTLLQKFAYGPRGKNLCHSSIRRERCPNQKAAFLQAIHNAGNRAMCQIYSLAQVLQANAAMPAHYFHHMRLRACQVAACMLRFQRFAHGLVDYLELHLHLTGKCLNGFLGCAALSQRGPR